MAKNEKMVTQAYPATVIVDGKPVAPGTPVTLPESEANSIAATFGVIPGSREEAESSVAKAVVAKTPVAKAQKPTKATLSALEKAVADARTAYDEADRNLRADTAGDAEAAAFTAAEKALDQAEKALAEAKGQ